MVLWIRKSSAQVKAKRDKLDHSHLKNLVKSSDLNIFKQFTLYPPDNSHLIRRRNIDRTRGVLIFFFDNLVRS